MVWAISCSTASRVWEALCPRDQDVALGLEQAEVPEDRLGEGQVRSRLVKLGFNVAFRLFVSTFEAEVVSSATPPVGTSCCRLSWNASLVLESTETPSNPCEVGWVTSWWLSTAEQTQIVDPEALENPVTALDPVVALDHQTQVAAQGDGYRVVQGEVDSRVVDRHVRVREGVQGRRRELDVGRRGRSGEREQAQEPDGQERGGSECAAARHRAREQNASNRCHALSHPSHRLVILVKVRPSARTLPGRRRGRTL